jgi:hypothetical protein
MLRAAGETEAAQEDIRDWFELDEGEPRFELVSFIVFKLRFYSVIVYLFLSALPILLIFLFICFLLFLRVIFVSLILITFLSPN